MTTTTQTEIVTEIRECLKAESAGRVLTATDTEVRIQFKNAMDATSWVSNYARESGARFENLAASFTKPVVVVLELAAYEYCG